MCGGGIPHGGLKHLPATRAPAPSSDPGSTRQLCGQHLGHGPRPSPRGSAAARWAAGLPHPRGGAPAARTAPRASLFLAALGRRPWKALQGRASPRYVGRELGSAGISARSRLDRAGGPAGRVVGWPERGRGRWASPLPGRRHRDPRRPRGARGHRALEAATLPPPGPRSPGRSGAARKGTGRGPGSRPALGVRVSAGCGGAQRLQPPSGAPALRAAAFPRRGAGGCGAPKGPPRRPLRLPRPLPPPSPERLWRGSGGSFPGCTGTPAPTAYRRDPASRAGISHQAQEWDRVRTSDLPRTRSPAPRAWPLSPGRASRPFSFCK